MLFLFPSVSDADSDDELLALARAVVARSPADAIGWARSQAEPRLRQRLLFAVVRAWGEIEPVAAVNWALVQDEGERQKDMEAALDGLAVQPLEAFAIGMRLLAEDPSDANGYGAMLESALTARHEFQTAIDLAEEAPAELRTDWLALTYRRWTQAQPAAAMRSLAAMTDGPLRDQLFHAAMDGWGATDPAGLAAYAATLPSGPNQSYAYQQAIHSWCLQDPTALAEWLGTAPAGVDYDQAITLMITTTDSANRSPAVAMQWVENINDSTLRQNSFLHVLQEWTQIDMTAARQYVANASWISESQREQLLKLVTSDK